MGLINESDRGAVILGAALLENELSTFLRQVLEVRGLSVGQVKSMFNFNGPLSSLSSKAMVCYGFGLISKDVFDDLSKIRKLRNKFAHSSDEVDFLAPGMEDEVMNIRCCLESSKKNNLQRYDFRSKPSPDEKAKLEDWEARSMGFVKATKSVFCIGVQSLLTELLECRIAYSSALPHMLEIHRQFGEAASAASEVDSKQQMEPGE